MRELINQTDFLVLLGVITVIVLIAAIFYIKYDVLQLGRLAKNLAQMSVLNERMPESQRDRMDYLLTLAKESGNRSLSIAWEDYYRDYSILMKGELVPDVREYINEQRLIEIPCGRKFMNQLSQELFMLGASGVLLYLAIALWKFQGVGASGGIVVQSVSIALFSLALVSVILFVFTLLDAANVEKARQSLWAVQYQVAGWLNPVTEATMIGVLVESQRQHSKVFREVVGQLEQRLDHFETGALAPVLGRMFQEAVENKLVPVLRETTGVLTILAETVVIRQENGMRELAQTFAEKLTTITADRLTGFVEASERASHALTDVVVKMEQIEASMERSTEAQEIFGSKTQASLLEVGRIQVEVSGALKTSLASVQAAEGIAGEMQQILVRGLDKADAMNRQSLKLQEGNLKHVEGLQQGIGIMTETIQKTLEASIAQVSSELTKAVTDYAGLSALIEVARNTQTDQLVVELDKRLMAYSDVVTSSVKETDERLQVTLKTLLEAQEKTVERLAATATEVSLEGGKILEKTSLQVNELYGGLAGRMDQSIDSLGENLAAVMKAAMGDSADIVERLALKTEDIKELYDSYFTRVEGQSTKILDEMDFNIQKMFGSFSEETVLILGRLTDQSSNTLEFFDKGIKDLSANMDEHTRSIGLYAKEINMDVADLSVNLRSSVQEFSTQMEVGITHTFEGFDQGLGEVTLRLATILDNIRESAEALQKALARQE